MAEESIMQCKKAGHQNQKYMFFNMSSEKKENLLICPICIQQKYLEQQDIHQEKQKTLLIEQLQNDQKMENLVGWPPIQKEDHLKIYQNHENFKQEFGLENESVLKFFIKMINDFYGNLQKEILQEIQNKKKNTIIWLENYFNNEFQNFQADFGYKNMKEIIQQFDIKSFKEKFREFEQKKLDIEQLFEYKQQQNFNIYNNEKIFNSLQSQYEKVEELKQELEKEFTTINESLDPFKKYSPKIKAKTQQQQQQLKYLKLYKSDYKKDYNKGNFEIDNEARTIKFKNSDTLAFIYSENLEQEKEYHLRFTMDTKNRVKNIYLAFSITSGNEKNSKHLVTDHYVGVIDCNSNFFAKGGEFLVEGKKNLCEFFKDNQTIMNVVFSIDKKVMEIYDDDRISYLRLNFNNNSNNFDEWILGISYILYNNDQVVDIQFID